MAAPHLGTYMVAGEVHAANPDHRAPGPRPPCDHDGRSAPLSCDLAGLKDVDGLGQLPGLPRAAAQLAQDAPGLELGVGALAGDRSWAWALLAPFWEAGLFRPGKE
jgi:hypothetical protein